MKAIYYFSLKVRFFIITVVIILSLMCISIMLSRNIILLSKLIFGGLYILSSISFLTMFLKRIYIDNEGVKYKDLLKTYYMGWEEISNVGIAIFQPRPIAIIRVIYFTTQDENIKNFGPKRVSGDFIYFKANKKILELVRQNWKGNINNEY